MSYKTNVDVTSQKVSDFNASRIGPLRLGLPENEKKNLKLNPDLIVSNHELPQERKEGKVEKSNFTLAY